MADDPVHPPAERTDRNPWNWLLLVPIVVPMLTFLYDDLDPQLFGFPRFYWLQLAFIGLGVVCTTIVYRMTRRKREVPTATARERGARP
ncbi:MAG TPA: DUF3311 domain-containing protein [Kofleriaceae bacterium]|nr:DUF3311 domain-containing protein [Kofleriaceae bacterium]